MDSIDVQDFQLTYEDELGREIHGLITRPGDAEGLLPTVIVVHGFKGFLKWGFFPELQKRLALSGFVSVAFNLSGSGVGEDMENFTDDDGFFASTPSRDVEDLECVRLFLENAELPNVDPTRLALLGHSRGGGTVLLHAERDGRYFGVVTWSSVGATLRFPDEVLANWRRDGQVEVPNARTGQVHRIGVGWLDDAEENADELDIEAACSRSTTPTLVVHGTEDGTVPFDDAERLVAAFSPGVARLERIEGAGHTFGAVHPFQGTTEALERAFAATLGFLGACAGAPERD